MTNPTPLSPAAQAVLDAAYNGANAVIFDTGDEIAMCAAAALRAVADQVVPESCFETDDLIRDALLAIADELERA